MKKVTWGILSTAKIGWEKVVPAMQQSALCDMRAVASRNLDAAKAYAAKLGIPVAYGSYQELFDDPAIEAIYNPLPNEQHVPMTLAAARAGKHVLCEKPFALNANEMAALREVADKVHIMEAFMVRHHPQWARVRELVRSGQLGEVRTLQSHFSYFNTDAANIRNRPEHGGGALYDIGCYPIVCARYVFGAEPVRVLASVDRDPVFKTDRAATGILDFGAGRRLDFTVSTQSVPYQRFNVVGTTGRVEVCIPFNAPLGETTDLIFDRGLALDGSQNTRENIPACNMYTLQSDAFAAAVRGTAPLPYGLDDAISNARVIDALFQSEKTGGWVNV